MMLIQEPKTQSMVFNYNIGVLYWYLNNIVWLSTFLNFQIYTLLS